jgi:hypothetical protein
MTDSPWANKVIKRHASGIDTGYCAAYHWSG